MTDEIIIGVAIAIPEPYGDDLTRWRKDFGDPLAAAIPPHVTLLPPTPVLRTQLPAIREHLEAAAAPLSGFTMRLRGTGTFRPVSPVVFVQVAEGIAACEKIESRVRSGILERELTFNYHPHVTVAHHLDDDALDHAFDTLSDYEATFRVSSFELFEHGDDGVWRPALSFALNGMAEEHEA